MELGAPCELDSYSTQATRRNEGDPPRLMLGTPLYSSHHEEVEPAPSIFTDALIVPTVDDGFVEEELANVVYFPAEKT